MSASDHERELAFQLQHATDLHFEQEYKFHPTRNWRADFAIWAPRNAGGDRKPLEGELPTLLVEVEGAIRGLPGRHQRIDGMENDCEKYYHALLLGYVVLRVMPSQVKSGHALVWIERLLEKSAQTAGSVSRPTDDDA